MLHDIRSHIQDIGRHITGHSESNYMTHTQTRDLQQLKILRLLTSESTMVIDSLTVEMVMTIMDGIRTPTSGGSFMAFGVTTT